MKRVSSVLASLLVLGALLAPAAGAAPGELDPSFGTGGSVRFLPSHEDIALRGLAIQADDKIVLTGGYQATNSILVVRLLENGALDPSFGSGGVVATTFPAGASAEGRAVAIQPDGKIVVVGVAKGAANGDFVALRYDANGAPDPSFGGGDGIQIIPVGAEGDRAEAVTIGAGGRILLTGEAGLPGSKVEVGVAVLQSDGKPDPSFGGAGVERVSTTGMAQNDRGRGIAEQPDGKIVIADATGGNYGFTLVRLLPNAKTDPGFGTAGIVNTPIPGAVTAKGQVADLLLQPDGRIVAAGNGRDEVGAKTDPKFAAVRYLANGELDKSFGGGTGIFSQQLSAGENEGALWIARTVNGKLVLAGEYSLPSPANHSLAVMRLDPSGIPDPTFGSGGIALRGATAPFGNLFDDAGLDSRERVVVASRDFIGGGDTEIEVSRFLGDLPPESPPPTDTTAPGGSPAEAKTQPPAPRNQPHARINKVPRKLETTKLTRFSGTAAAAAGGTLARVQIALVKAASAKAGSAATCQELQNAKGRFKVVKAVRGNCPLLWLNATGTAKWSFRLKTVLPPGRYVVYSRAVESAGIAETSFSRAAGNRFGFRLLAPESGSL